MNPVLVNLWRGSAIESRHRGAVAVVDSKGQLVYGLGDIDRAEFPRSSIKFLQAIAFVESGAVEHFSLTDRHISLSCASHNGEAVHTDLVSEWLETIRCGNDDLECGAELPLHPDTQFELIASGAAPQRIHHNCSGKHLGLLSTVKYMGESTKDYRLINHPAQRRWFDILESLAEIHIADLPWGYDGCGIPALALPLHRMAFAMAKLANPNGLDKARVTAIERITAAIAAEPYMIAGASRLCTALVKLTGKDVLVKTGAEGYYTAVLPRLGLGVALKADDGHKRASQVMLGEVLLRLGAITQEQYQALAEYVHPDLTNSRGEVIGHAEPSSEWLAYG